MKKPLHVIAGSILLLLILMIGLWILLSNSVRKSFLEGIGEYLQAKVEFQEFHLDLFSGKVRAGNGTIHSLDPQAAWGDATIGLAEEEFNLLDLFKSITPASIELDQVSLHLGKRPDEELTLQAPPSESTPKNATTGGWPKIEVRKFTLHHGTITGDDKNPLKATSVEILTEKNEGSEEWSGVIKSQTVSVSTWDFGLSKAHFTTAGDKIEVDSYELDTEEGTVEGHAQIPFDLSKNSQVHYKLNGLPIAFLIPASWRLILVGSAQGTGEYDGPLLKVSDGQATGQIRLQPAMLALPFLKSLASKLAFVPGLSGIGNIALDTAQTDYQYDKGALKLTNLRLEKTNLAVFTGGLDFNNQGQLDGTIKLGLPTLLISLVPKLKESVFTTDDQGYSWADVKISGTPEHLQEDLTPRVLSALGTQAGDLFQGLKDKAGGLLDSLMKK